jgi:hypothetical protein
VTDPHALRLFQRRDLSRVNGHTKRRVWTMIDRIVIHRNTVADDVDGVEAWYRSPPKGQERYRLSLFPYHFFVDEDAGGAFVSQVHPIGVISPHAGPQGFNPRGIGIALNVDGRTVAPSSAMRGAVVALLTRLVVLLPRAPIVCGHSAEKGCPGRLVDVDGMATEAKALATRAPMVVDDIAV